MSWGGTGSGASSLRGVSVCVGGALLLKRRIGSIPSKQVGRGLLSGFPKDGWMGI